MTSRVLGGYEESDSLHRQIHQHAFGRDHLWIAKEEISRLVAGRFPASLEARMAPLLNDNTRGEPGRWRKSEIKTFEVTMTEGRLSGTAHFENAAGDRGYKAEILGFIAADGHVTASLRSPSACVPRSAHR